MAKSSVNVVVDERHIANIDEVVARLRGLGLEVSNVGRSVGVIVGETEQDPATFEAVEGVKMIVPARSFRAT